MSMPLFPPNRLRRRKNAMMANGIKVETTLNEVEFSASETQTATPKFSHSPNSAFGKPRNLTEIPNNGLQDIQFELMRYLALPRPFQTIYFDDIVNAHNIHHILPRQEWIDYTQFPNIPDTNAAMINIHSSCESNGRNMQDIHTKNAWMINDVLPGTLRGAYQFPNTSDPNAYVSNNVPPRDLNENNIQFPEIPVSYVSMNYYNIPPRELNRNNIQFPKIPETNLWLNYNIPLRESSGNNIQFSDIIQDSGTSMSNNTHPSGTSNLEENLNSPEMPLLVPMIIPGSAQLNAIPNIHDASIENSGNLRSSLNNLHNANESLDTQNIPLTQSSASTNFNTLPCPVDEISPPTRIQLCDRCRKHPVICTETDSDSDENGNEPEIECRSRNVFFVEKILKKRVVLGEEQYYVKWMGYNKDFNSWEPRRSFVHDVMVENYEKKIQDKRNAKRLKNRVKRTQNRY